MGKRMKKALGVTFSFIILLFLLQIDLHLLCSQSALPFELFKQ